MSAGEILKPVSVTLCDLCGKEIDANTPAADKVSMLGYKSQQVSPASRWAMFRWNPSRKEGEKWTAENRYRSYDFHGKCTLDVLESAIEKNAAARKAAEEFTSILPDVSR